MYKKPYHVHFIGIGGIGMSGIAQVLLHQGYIVSGCDAQADQKSCQQLKKQGGFIYQGNNTPACDDSSINCVVYSTAITHTHPELIRARERNIPTLHRAEMLAELMRSRYGIGVSGAHGKTTTTGMIAHLLLSAELDPSIIIGGFLRTIDSNAHAGTGQWFVAEADESDRSFLTLPSTIAVVTNIDKEHLETYRDMDDIIATFTQFITQIPAYGCAVLCTDNEPLRALIPTLNKRVITYGFSDDAHIRGTAITCDATTSSCTVMRGIQELGTLTLPMPGMHMLQNALASVAVGLELDIPFATIARALQTYPGIERRFSYHGTFNGAAVYDDYGHHPNEIIPTIAMARTRTTGKLILVFQPHRYSRIQGLWSEFIETLGTLPVNQLIMTDLYSAGETPITDIDTHHLIDAIKNRHAAAPIVYAPYTSDHEALKTTIAAYAHHNDLVLLMGAGSIYTLAQTLCNET